MKKILIAMLAFGQATVLWAQIPYTPEVLWQFGRLGEASVSPDNKNVLYTVTYTDLAENKNNSDLFIQPVTGGQPRRLTQTPGSEHNPVWRPDGKKVAFLSAESGSTQLYEMNPDGTGKKQVTNLAGGIGNFKYAPNQQHVLFTQEVKVGKAVQDWYPDLPKAEARIIDDLMFRHWSEWDDLHVNHIFFAGYQDGSLTSAPRDIMAGEPFDAPLQPFGGTEQMTFSPDGNFIVYTSKKVTGKEYALSTDSDLYLYDLRTGQTENLTKGMLGYDNEPSFSPDGTKLAWLSMETAGYEADKNRIFVYDFKTKTKEDITASTEQSAGSLQWSPNGRKIYFVSILKGTEQIYEADVRAKKVRQLTSGTLNYNSIQLAGDQLVANKTTISQPAELVRVSLKNGKEMPITTINQPLLSQLRLGKVEARTIKTTDGKDMLTYVIYPADFDPTKKYPTLLYCQGGPQSPVSQVFSYRWNLQLIAQQGYIVVAPNRRGLPGFGTEWNRAISGDWGGQAIQDYLSAIDEVAKEPFVDKDRLGAVGASYGGYSVYYLAGMHNKRFKTFIAHCGLFNLDSWYGSTEELFFANFDIGGPYYGKTTKSYELFSPHRFVQNWDTPILVIHGEKDFRVPINQGIEAFNAAQLKNIPSRFLYFPEEGHWVLKPQNSVLWYRVFFEWLDKYLKDGKS